MSQDTKLAEAVETLWGGRKKQAEVMRQRKNGTGCLGAP
jgi:hypothetical protein